MVTFKKYSMVYCLALLLVSVLEHVSCKPADSDLPELDWWQSAVYYQIYPRSFKDSDGDGIGDLNGITSKLQHLKNIGVDATWLSPIFKSPMFDFGYDISDFYSIQKEYGTMEDFENLLAKAKELGIKIILDFVPNHCSNESMWFQESLKGNEKYKDWFIWEQGKIDAEGKRHPPNNWVSVFRKSAWEYKEERDAYYLHQFVIGQPDLNYRNPEVVKEMKNVLKFWLEKGVDGFRVDAVPYLFEVDRNNFNGMYPDEPVNPQYKDLGPDDYNYLSHIYTRDQEETYDTIVQWREVLDEFKARDGETRVMLTEGYASIDNVIKYYGSEDKPGAQIPFNFQLIENLKKESTAVDFKAAIDKWLKYMPAGKTANWVVMCRDKNSFNIFKASSHPDVERKSPPAYLFNSAATSHTALQCSAQASNPTLGGMTLWLGNHDNSRVASRFGVARVDAINMLLLLLPGIGVTYMGEEIGMVDGWISWEETVDPSACNTDDPINYYITSRDPVRTPFQWDDGKNAGFSKANKTWLPVAAGYQELNVEAQKNVAKSHYGVYSACTELRRQPTFRHGDLTSLVLNQDVFAFTRILSGYETFVVVLNLGPKTTTVDLRKLPDIDTTVEVVIPSSNSERLPGSYIKSDSCELGPNEALVLRGIPE